MSNDMSGFGTNVHGCIEVDKRVLFANPPHQLLYCFTQVNFVISLTIIGVANPINC